MSDVELKNMAFESGMELKVTGVTKPCCSRFSINVGHSKENIALHFNPRFHYGGDQEVTVINSCKDGCWQEEVKEKYFPFRLRMEFEVTIIFADDKFYINQHNGHVVQFPNRPGDKEYDYIWIEGDVTVKRIHVN
ncbi:galactose-binding lectin l-1-like isoform X3 [Anguilla rostrata]|uniref:galactose-binding lectin l-1-like isoform X1 n=1 Tax=Anguilla rostrata TaxID=7938 RepID=UPI0030CACEA9